MSSPYADSRILAPRDVLLGTGNPKSLQNVNTYPLPDGAACYVLDQRDWFVLDKNSTDPASGTDVVVAIVGRWKRSYSRFYTVNWQVADWYIDGTVGIDTNDGTTVLTPLRTGAELQRRLGPYAIWDHSVTVHVGINGMIDLLVLCGSVAVGSHVDVIGTPTNVASDTVASYANLSHATPSETLIGVTSTVTLAPYLGFRILITNGVASGAVLWIANVSPGGIGVKNASVNRACRIDATNVSGMTNTTAVNPAPGDSLVIQSVPSVPAIVLRLDAEPVTSPAAQYPNRTYTIQSVSCPVIDVDGPANRCLYRGMVFGSKIGLVRTRETVNSFANVQAGCNVAFSDPCVVGSNAFAGHLFCSIVTTNLWIYPGVVARMTYVLLQNAWLNIQPGSHLVCQDIQAFDNTSANNAPFLVYQSSLTANRISGARNVAYGIAALDNSRLTLQGTVNVLGAVSNYWIAGAGANGKVALAAQFCLPNDYAQKGTTVAMVAGSVTVTVPWYDNVTQKVTATVATPGGARGFLSVTQTSSTQFTITSSSATETSTINWQISPLGRNVLVSTT
jgi:hypothetical protein